MSSLHFGRRGCILADGWAALHRGEKGEGECGREHRRARMQQTRRVEARKNFGKKANEPHWNPLLVNTMHNLN
jgi:hypothetical protein